MFVEHEDRQKDYKKGDTGSPVIAAMWVTEPVSEDRTVVLLKTLTPVAVQRMRNKIRFVKHIINEI